jgi:Fe2+ or Zn2+ uptake regulation protein
VNAIGPIPENLAGYLKQNGVKPSLPRLKVLEYLRRHKNHPTVDTIYRELVREIPTLSRTTVYNTLKLFVEKGISQLIAIEETETRYDADISPHAHFKCTGCGRIYDFPVDLSRLNPPGLADFRVDDIQVYYRGVCRHCLANRKAGAAAQSEKEENK